MAGKYKFHSEAEWPFALKLTRESRLHAQVSKEMFQFGLQIGVL